MWVEKHRAVYRIRDRVGGKPVTIAGGFATKEAAKDAMAMHRADQLRGDQLVPGGGKATLDQWIDEWWPHHEASLKATTVHSEGGRLRNHIRPLLGGYTLTELEAHPMLVQGWVSYLSAGEPDPERSTSERAAWKRRPLAAKTVHNCHGLLFTLLDAAVVARRIRVNPCNLSAKSLPRRVSHEMRFLTDPEIGRLLAAIPTHYRPLILLLVATGLRWGEATGLHVRNVDLLAERPKLRVVEQLQEIPPTYEMVWTDPKSVRSRRTVSFTVKVALALTPLVAGRGRDDVVFTTVNGHLIRARNFHRIWRTATLAAGLTGLRIHDLRHTHVAVLIAANRQLSAISRRLGHSSVAVTDAIYGHLREEVDDGILAAIDASLAGIDLEPDDTEPAAILAELRDLDVDAEVEAELGDPFAA